MKILLEKKIIPTFYQKEIQKTNQKEFRIKKVIKSQGNKLYVKWKGEDSSFNSWLDKKILLCKMSYFPEPHTNKNKKEVELDLSNCATKPNLKIATSVDTSQFDKIYDLANLKSDVDKLDI